MTAASSVKSAPHARVKPSSADEGSMSQASTRQTPATHVVRAASGRPAPSDRPTRAETATRTAPGSW
eukprot:7311052-Prymnesium_polylepis.1